LLKLGSPARQRGLQVWLVQSHTDEDLTISFQHRVIYTQTIASLVPALDIWQPTAWSKRG